MASAMASKIRSRNSWSDASVVDPASRDKYMLQISAGPSYDSSTHQVVNVNGDEAHCIENDIMKCWLKVRIRDYHGLPKTSPSTNSYFEHPMHISDRYSIGFSFVPKKDIPGEDLVTGFDFDHSIRDRLPPGFKYAMKIVTTILDPGVYSDPYSDKPYLYGPGLSSFFAFRIGEHVDKSPAEQQLAEQLRKDGAGVVEEGADGSGKEIREKLGTPSKINKRRKFFLDQKKMEKFTFEAGRLYQADFFNPYLDFANFALRIPGFSISVAKYIDNKTHELRFVVKNRRTEEVLFVVIFTLLFGEKLEQAVRGDETSNVASEQVSRPSSSEATIYSTPSSRSSSPRPRHREQEEQDDHGGEEESSTVSALANTIYSSFSYLGFGRTESSSDSSTNPSTRNPSPDALRRKSKIADEVEPQVVEELLRKKHEST